MPDYEIFELGDAVLSGGATLRGAKLAYKTFGELSPRKDNVIVYPTWYSAQHYENEWLIGEGMALDPRKYFIIIPNMLGNGLSSSPSNTPEPYDRARFPNVTVYDQVRLQHRLVTEKFGIEKLALVTGWSMGAAQTFQWAASYPEMVERILPFQGAARCSRHNFVFLEGVKAALTADAAYNYGWYDEPPQPIGAAPSLMAIYTVTVQQELARRGYHVGAADGVLGRRTRAAIRDYQRDHGLPVTGEVSLELVNHLRLVTTTAALPS